MTFTIFSLIAGLTLLIVGGAALVHGASQLASRFGISPMVVGLTIVAFGTSLPELVVNTLSATFGETGLAFGNVVGSNVANLALVLGLAACFRPIEIQGTLVQRELPLLLLATGIVTAMLLDHFTRSTPAMIDKSDALVLLLVFCIFLYMAILDFVRRRNVDPILADVESNPLVPAEPAAGFAWLSIPAGAAALYFGGELTVNHAVDLASNLNVSPNIVGLFVVALGTSMPELVTSIIAAVRKESDLALGNVIGSNLFNTLAVLPATALILPVALPKGAMIDLLFSLALAVALIPVFFLGKARLGRPVGALFLASYGAWCFVRLTS